jgi:hypothetical protein
MKPVSYGIKLLITTEEAESLLKYYRFDVTHNRSIRRRLNALRQSIATGKNTHVYKMTEREAETYFLWWVRVSHPTKGGVVYEYTCTRS